MEIHVSARKHGITDIEDFIASIAPASMRDGRHLRAIARRRQALDDADVALRQAVEAARAAGDSWTMIGIALGTSKQNAFRKYHRSGLVAERDRPQQEG